MRDEAISSPLRVETPVDSTLSVPLLRNFPLHHCPRGNRRPARIPNIQAVRRHPCPRLHTDRFCSRLLAWEGLASFWRREFGRWFVNGGTRQAGREFCSAQPEPCHRPVRQADRAVRPALPKRDYHRLVWGGSHIQRFDRQDRRARRRLGHYDRITCDDPAVERDIWTTAALGESWPAPVRAIQWRAEFSVGSFHAGVHAGERHVIALS